MELKKNPNADLEKKSGLFMNIGLCVSLLLVITAFEWRFYDRGSAMDLGNIEDDFEDLLEIPPTEQPPPPPPVIQQPEIIEVPDEEEIETVGGLVFSKINRILLKWLLLFIFAIRK